MAPVEEDGGSQCRSTCDDFVEVGSKGVTLEYEPHFGGNAWVTRELKAAGKVTLSRVFFFRSSDLVAETAHGAAHDDEADEDDRPLYRFRFATTKDGYHRIPGRILGIDNDVLIVAEGIAPDRKVFVAERNISIFRRIAKLKPGSEIVVGGDRVDSIAVEAFGELLEIRLYRGNSVPTKELSGTIMQAEKYLFHLSKWGVEGERELSKRYGSALPAGLQIRVTNPKALLLLGRDRRTDGTGGLTENQSFDLEVIKRKYVNMMDIVPYDDLLRRLDRIIVSLTERAGSAGLGQRADKRGTDRRDSTDRCAGGGDASGADAC
ncbi:DUF4263 domain-containing protein [Mesorhizobium japonicum R7A]|uniref:Shedu immune nuclease family protein n=3 Tax=Mesorhizobium TaxID=68287 RepID=A0ABZ0VHT2_9HYPH|nr:MULTISPECIES: Shedu immune nuclease family protein [Mesorhizobium]QGX80572.1 DUF4263 domain-containing protein [Mesorhizobium japonicum R7A]QJF10789.1 DUF4263 domain-containing protein [Mesorhizobium japonicum]MBZ9910182.1 DUF4263 domain-containing protein [Mesorhizobium sp. BR115XR7A]QJF04720.1 DUF4263 domain-containing protein [Mesorhizobium japonicum R7A]QJI86662.1 DUF4263 domain-containing protein [Mesorhizobium japonicum]